MNIKIRKECPKDYKDIYELIKLAFATAEHSDGDEQDLATNLRESDCYIPELALVAQMDGRILGHIMFTKITIADTPAITLAPLSVLPEMQGKGIGGALIAKGHSIAKDLGYEYSILIGHAAYYPRFGYKMASSFGITSPIDVPDENHMVCDLQGKNSSISGQVKYPKVWGIN